MTHTSGPSDTTDAISEWEGEGGAGSAPAPARRATGAGHVRLQTRCAHCRGGVELDCEPLQGFWGYKTYNEYFCPHCRKQNHERTTGAIVAARPATAEPRR
jgi:hypothetical protein